MQDKYAIVFPGQGSQSVGMLKDLALEYPMIKDTFDEASRVIDIDLWDLAQNGPEERLNQTEFTQPVLLAACVAVWRVWRSEKRSDNAPSFLAGHSLGEYAALVCAESISFTDGVKLVRDRGRFMQEAYTEKGAMVAVIGLSDEMIQGLCKESSQDGVLMVANYNSIGQTVLAGDLASCERALLKAKELGARVAKILSVSVPSHCTLMKPAAKNLAKVLSSITINTPKIPVIHNADVSYYNDPQKICDSLARQLYNPVRWVEIIQLMVKNGVKCVLECGPGKVLTGLNKRIDKDINADFIGDPKRLVNYL